ncbi:MAG TPA: 4-hydroxy-tetrahydrodipicolinate synthase [Bdellovibrionales bacterium]|nr:4-hydroxy-tetrahydrodipicolinate synthase [Bdellovibrionales bacterium]
MKDLSGVLTALITPFKNGEVDWKSLAKLVRFQVDGGVSGFVISGTTAESPTLSKDEKKKIFEFVKSESGGKLPLVMGTGSNSTSESIEATKAAEQWGADAALVVVPYYNKPPQRGVFQHFQKVAESSSLPILLYNVPGRTITKLELDTIVELSHLKNIVGIKEATGDIEFGRRVVKESAENFLVTSGDDGTFIELVGVGGEGVISVASHILPKEFSSWCARARKGDTAPREEFLKYNDLNSYLYVEANPIPIKMALHLMGVIESPELRLPLTKLTEPYTAELKNKMTAVGLL